MGAASSVDERIFQIKITLRGVSKPPICRRILVPARIRLDRFHDAIQTAMGWLDYHTHVFSAESGDYGSADPELGHKDERRITLGAVLEESGGRLVYTYDFGDDPADGHDEMLEWLGLDSAGEFDPAAFDVDEVNESLAAVSAAR